MTDQTKTPERIWATSWGLPDQEESGTFVAVGDRYPTAPNADALSYTRADLSDAKIAEAEQRGYASAMDAERKDADARIEELEANLAKVVAIANRRGVYVPTGAVECRGDKCREMWCASCCGDDATAYVRKVTDQDATDRAALAALKGGG